MEGEQLTIEQEADTELLLTMQGMPAAKSLVAKLAEACDAVGGVEKLGTNETQKYKYMRAADIAKAFRHELFRRGILMIPNEQVPEYLSIPLSADREGNARSINECRIAVDFLVTDGTESLHFVAHGVGRDSGDKALYKAKTGATKYFLRAVGLVPDEKDDPEVDELGEAIVKRSPKEQKDFAEAKVSKLKQELEASIKATPKVTEPVPPAAKGPKTISDAQRKRLWAISKQHGWGETELRELLGSHGFEHTTEITPTAYSEIIATIEASGNGPH